MPLSFRPNRIAYDPAAGVMWFFASIQRVAACKHCANEFDKPGVIRDPNLGFFLGLEDSNCVRSSSRVGYH